MNTRSAVVASTVVAVVVGHIVAGCGSLPDATSPLIGCRPQDITILEDHIGATSRNWVAQCRGQRYLCGTVGRQVNCTAEQSESAAQRDAVPTVPRRPAATAAVERARDAAGHVRLRMTLRIGELETQLQASPSEDATRMYLIISGPEVNAECAAGALIDGAIEPVTQSHADSASASGRYLGTLPLATLRRMLSARRAAIRVCDAEGRLDDETRAALDEFAARFDEELAWQRGATSGAESPTPSGSGSTTAP